MKNLTCILFALTFLLGCRDINGQLNVTAEDPDTGFQLSYLNQPATLQLFNGDYDSTIKLRQKRRSTRIRLFVNDNGEVKEFRIQTRRRIEIPENGTFEISSDDSGVDASVNGEVQTVEVFDRRIYRDQSCGIGDQMRWETVEYNLYNVTQNVETVLSNATGTAHFRGVDRYVYEEYVTTGPCY